MFAVLSKLYIKYIIFPISSTKFLKNQNEIGINQRESTNHNSMPDMQCIGIFTIVEAQKCIIMNNKDFESTNRSSKAIFSRQSYKLRWVFKTYTF